MASLRFGRHASASPATQVGLAALSQPGSHLGGRSHPSQPETLSVRESIISGRYIRALC